MDFNEANQLVWSSNPMGFLAFNVESMNETLCTDCIRYKDCNMRRHLENEGENIQYCYYYVKDMR